jgi:hypothetical protein
MGVACLGRSNLVFITWSRLTTRDANPIDAAGAMRPALLLAVLFCQGPRSGRGRLWQGLALRPLEAGATDCGRWHAAHRRDPRWHLRRAAGPRSLRWDMQAVAPPRVRRGRLHLPRVAPDTRGLRPNPGAQPLLHAPNRHGLLRQPSINALVDDLDDGLVDSSRPLAS